MTAPTEDAIDAILATVLDADGRRRVAAIRGQKPDLAAENEAYYRAVFAPEPDSAAALPPADRAVVAVRVAAHARDRAVADWYAALAERGGAARGAIDRARDLADPWPEATPLAAAVRHADLLVVRPATARREDLLALKTAGFSPAGIVALSQVVAFVSYQLRLVAVLRALGEPR
jgi:uncharacterized protein YciW